MPTILHIESATSVCSVCLSRGNDIIAVRETPESNRHGSQLTNFIQEVVQEVDIIPADIDAIAISSGPGSYTGLRIGSSVAKGMCYTLKIPLIAVSTLRALALAAVQQVYDSEALYISMIDARRMEVYAAIYDCKGRLIRGDGSWILSTETINPILLKNKKLVLSGDGSRKAKELFPSSGVITTEVLCSACHLVPLSLEAYHKKTFVNVSDFEPNYLKGPNITIPKRII